MPFFFGDVRGSFLQSTGTASEPNGAAISFVGESARTRMPASNASIGVALSGSREELHRSSEENRVKVSQCDHRDGMKRRAAL